MVKALVMGCGESVRGYLPPIPKTVFIYGVNDSTRWNDCDARLILDRPTGFRVDLERAEHIREAKPGTSYFLYPAHWAAQGLVTDENEPIRIQHINKDSDLGDIDPDKLWFCRTSTSSAIWLAYLHGYDDIGLLGVDHVSHKLLAPHKDDIEMGFRKIHEHLHMRQVRLVNLSSVSALEAVPKMDLEEWLDE